MTDVEVQNATVAADKMDGEARASRSAASNGSSSRPRIRKWITIAHGADGSVQPTVNEAAITKALKPVAKGVKRPPAVGGLSSGPGGRVVGVAPAKDGRRLDAAATAAAIAAAITDRGTGAAPAPVKVRVLEVAPKLTTEEAVKKGPLMSMLGTWKTWFPVSDHNFFGANIWQPAKIIDGTVLYPGQRFEWWSAVGPGHDQHAGSVPAGSSRATTRSRPAPSAAACARARRRCSTPRCAPGLQMGARSNHKYYIYRYPLGLDATVSKTPGGGGQTMSFTNDMKHPIVIRSYRYTAGGRGLGPVRDLGHPGWPQGQPLEAVRVQRHPGDDRGPST